MAEENKPYKTDLFRTMCFITHYQSYYYDYIAGI